MQKFYQNEPAVKQAQRASSGLRNARFNGVYLRNNLYKIKDEKYIINPDEYKSIET